MSNTSDVIQWRWASVKKAVMNYYIENPDTKPIVAIRDISKHYPYRDKKTRRIDTEKRRLYTSDRKKIHRRIFEFWRMGLLTTQGINKNLFLINNPIIPPDLEKYYFERQKIPPGTKLKLNMDHPLFEDYKNRYC